MVFEFLGIEVLGRAVGGRFSSGSGFACILFSRVSVVVFLVVFGLVVFVFSFVFLVVFVFCCWV